MSQRPLLQPLRSRSGGARLAHVLGAAVLGSIAVGVARMPGSLVARTAEPTYAREIAPIIYRNCATCHRPGGIGPFTLLEYDSAKAHVDEMRDAVSTGFMPPWHADGPRGVFRNDRRLSDGDKETILRWIAAGAQSGDLKAQPPRPEFPTSWTIGTPDLVVSMPEDFKVPASGTVEYQYFEVPTNLMEDKWVEAFQILPGANEVVHHVLVYAKVPPPPAATVAAQPPAPRPPGAPAAQPLFIRPAKYAIPPDPPRLDTLHKPPRQLGALIATEVPSTNMIEFPKGTALRLRAGTILTFQMHYTAHGHEMTDRTKIGFRFAKEMPDEEILASQFLNGALVIPAGAKDVSIPSEITATQPVRIWGLLPHTHLRGKRWQYTLVRPDSTTEVILDVPRYDFNWQTYYLFDKPLEVPAGGKIVSMAWYDNSSTNIHNPDPTIDVKWGDQTWEEMQYTGFLYSVPSRRLRPAP
jgi:hypothetical protein